eukprot:jgi/Chrzof1/3174/Cz12g14170.t1_PPD5[v5.2]
MSAAASSSSSPVISRRQAVLAAVCSAIASKAVLLPTSAHADGSDAQAFKSLEDKTLAYKFSYPTKTASGTPLQLTLTKAPEKYSSAAPLNADARQRIVSELFDLSKFVTVSMTVGPVSGVLKDSEPSQWKPMDVALTVLVDRSTARLSSGQRTALNDVEDIHVEERDGQKYWVYEHIAQGSPTIVNTQKETYRHALAVTTYRPGLDGTPYLYTLNLSCRQELWDDLAPQFQQAVGSFRLTETTSAYIAPDKDPWLFF